MSQESLSAAIYNQLAVTSLPPEKTLWTILLSGGLDSTVLLHAFSSLRDTHALPLQALHINHQLRGEEAEADARFCRNLCQSLEIPLVTRSFPVKALAGEQKVGLEEAGRNTRHRAMADILTEHPEACFVLAHHRDDQLETVLLNVQRGAHLRGLSGLKPYRLLRTADKAYLPLFRPLLAFTKSDLHSYAVDHGLDWREDLSNSDTGFERNRIRHEVIPLLDQVLPGFNRNMLSLSDACAQEDAALQQQARDLLTRYGEKSGDNWLLRWPEMTSDDRPRFLAAMGLLFEEHYGAPELCLAHYQALWRLWTRSQSGAVLQLPDRIRVRKECDGLWIYLEDGTHQTTGELLQLPPLPFRCAVAEGTLQAELRPPPLRIPEEDASNPDVQWLDADALRLPLTWGALREGERIRPLGAPGSKTISDLLIDKKIPARQRPAIRLLRDHVGAAWIHPLCLANRLRLKAETTRALRIELQRQK